ncbi:hypothetical protein LO772_21295 [Yinghuangia sp. ASG 101]|uniref:hypothetical protein n=1 Tax=Yinghuangia sp. ASG 101 TaxID=2896848 RepID=UPI001E419796|nr:hypothetical protein [Yinghuangia sp. ASG 101]UGQ09471.1 hypothetical protein LO772_21295 [Yinghuangia sp. ASG 101]
MSSTLPRRVAQAALLVAAGAAPVVGAASAHAVGVPLGNQPIDLPGASPADVTGVPFSVNGVTEAFHPAVGVPLDGAVDQVTRPGAVPRAVANVTDTSRVTDTATAAGPAVGALLDSVHPRVPDLREAPAVRKVQRIATQPGVADLVEPVTGPLAHPDTTPPSVDRAVRGGDAVARRLHAQVVRPAALGVGPALPITGYATDKSVNAAMPATDGAVALATGRHVVSNAALTVEGATTPLREMPRVI